MRFEMKLWFRIYFRNFNVLFKIELSVDRTKHSLKKIVSFELSYCLKLTVRQAINLKPRYSFIIHINYIPRLKYMYFSTKKLKTKCFIKR